MLSVLVFVRCKTVLGWNRWISSAITKNSMGQAIHRLFYLVVKRELVLFHIVVATIDSQVEDLCSQALVNNLNYIG